MTYTTPDYPPATHDGIRPNALVTINDIGTRINYRHHRITALPGHYSAIDVRADDCEIVNAYIPMGTNQAKGLVVHGDRQDGGQFKATNITIGRSPHESANGLLIDPGHLGWMSRAKLNSIRSENTVIKVACCTKLIARDLQVIEAPRYAFVVGEGVAEIDMRGFDLDGFFSHFSTQNNRTPDDEFCKTIKLQNGQITGRHDHLKSHEAVWQDIEWNMAKQLPGDIPVNRIAIYDETPISRVQRRIIKNVRFVGDGTPYYKAPGCGGKVETIGCTLNGKHWSYTG